MATVICPACQSPNSSDLEFCTVCGYELSQTTHSEETIIDSQTTAKSTDEVSVSESNLSELERRILPTGDQKKTLTSLKAFLVPKGSEHPGKRFILCHDQTYLVGRFDPDTGPVDIDLEEFSGNDTVSRQHAEIFFESGNWKVIDLGSTNGIFIRKANERRFSPRITVPSILEDQDEISFGKIRFRFSMEEM